MAARHVQTVTRFVSRGRGRKSRAFARMAALGMMSFAIPSLAVLATARAGSEESTPVPDVMRAFDDLTHHGEWMGYRNGAGAPVRPEPYSDHIQGIARSARPGKPLFFVTSAGQEHNGISDASLMVIRLGSRDETGERLRSNRLEEGKETSCTVPEEGDAIVYNMRYRYYNHPGGVHLVGDILAVALEQALPDGNETCRGGAHHGMGCASDADCPDGSCSNYPGQIRFYDTSDERVTTNMEATELSYRLNLAHGVGMVGITKLAEPDGRFLLVVNRDNGLEFLKSNETSFSADGFKFEYHDFWDPNDAQNVYWPVAPESSYQNYSFINEEGGRLFMLVGRNLNALAPVLPGEDVIALFEITENEDGRIIITQRREERIVSFYNDSSFNPLLDEFSACSQNWPPFTPSCPAPYCPVTHENETLNADLNASGTAYVSPSGELILYAIEHCNDGPKPGGGDPTVRMAELRHEHVVRDDSSTFHLTAHPGGPYTVDEGSSVQLDGRFSHASTAEPWVQLFEHIHFEGQSVMVDYADYADDDYDDFSELDGEPLFTGDYLCLDPQAIADLGEALNNIKITVENLAVGDLTIELCLGTWVDGNGVCWAVPPSPVYDECMDLCSAGYWTCYGVLCGIPCGFDPGGSACHNCLSPCRSERSGCEDICDGIEGEWVTIPDIISPAWDVADAVLQIGASFGPILASIDVCGRVLNTDFQQPPSPPNPLSYLDLDTYHFDPAHPETFLTTFGYFVRDLLEAIGALVDYVNSLIQYLDDLLLSLQGFNDRASSVRFYAPVGVDVALFERAHSTEGYTVLHGTGSVVEIPDLSVVNLSNGKDAHDRIRSVEFQGTFTNPTLTSHMWSVVSPTPPEPLAIQDATTLTPIFNAALGDGPSTAEVELVVGDSAGGFAAERAMIQILNVAPEVQIDTIEDQTGASIDGVIPVLLEALEYVLVGSFTDAGVPDTHTADVVWGDGSTNTSDDQIFQLTDSLGGVTGTVRAPHTYASTGTYSIALTVEDDDGDSTQVVHGVQVVDASGATQLSIDYLHVLLDGPPLKKDAARAIKKTLSMLEGNGGGNAKNGVLDFLEKGELNAALQKFKQALIYMAIAGELDPSLASLLEPVQRSLTLAAKSATVKAVAEANTASRSRRDRGKIGQAYEYLDEGDECLSAGDHVGAVSKYQRAIRLVQGML